ncbi:uncharacterized protein EV154DRAFT_508967, partial [Mucor mucedo]|uniref:uncharacterized protein n=1 Tax=Mucor mucedo TaxID=29922 RepID=UPI0022202405
MNQEGKKKKDIRPFSPLAHFIIRCRNGVSGRPDVPKNIYTEHLDWHNQEPSKVYPFSGNQNDYIDSVVDAASVEEFKGLINKRNDSSDEYNFIHAIFSRMKKVYTAKVPMTTSKSTFNYYLVHPLLKLVSEFLSEKTPCGFFPEEIALHAMRKVQKEEGKRDYLADALYKLLDYKQLEVLLLETSGPYKNNNATKIDFDNHKGVCDLLVLLKIISTTNKYAKIECF